jgi:hypothetical protein
MGNGGCFYRFFGKRCCAVKLIFRVSQNHLPVIGGLILTGCAQQHTPYFEG